MKKQEDDSENENSQNSDEEDGKIGAKKLKVGENDFLEVGSVSWSMLIAIYFLTLHDDQSDSCISFDSI